MHRICLDMWENSDWLDDWCNSVFVSLLKKENRKQCTNYSTIALVSHASKIMLRIILERMRTTSDMEISDEQAGFCRGRLTRDHITNLRLLMEKAQEHQQPLFMCFVDYQKAFDSVQHDKLFFTLLEVGFPIHLFELIRKLYTKQKAKVKAAGVLSDWFVVLKGVRQGCILFPQLFNLFAEAVMREALKEFTGGFRIGGRTITNLRYADDIIFITTSQTDLQKLVNRLDQSSHKYGLRINIDKTKVMATQGIIGNITIQGTPVEEVNTFVYLGALVTKDSNSTLDLKAKLAKGQGILSSLKTLWKNHNIRICTKVKLLTALVWPVASDGCESLTLKSTDEKKSTHLK